MGKFSKKGSLAALVIGASSLGLMAVSGTTLAANQATSLPHLRFHGTITMYPQLYMPVTKGVNEGPGTPKLQALNVLAAQFHKLYPNIRIKFVWPSLGANVTAQWVTTEAAAGQLPDIFWIWHGTVGPGAPVPSAVDYNLAPYFNQPNPFIPGNKAWKSVMPSWLLEQVTEPNGAIYVLDGDAVQVGFFYNKTLFKKAGLSGAPKTWDQLVADAKQLKAHGILPGADVPELGWWSAVLGENFLGPKVAALSTKLDTQFKDNGSEVAADLYRLGYLNEAKNSAVLAWWPMLKQLYQYWNPAQTTLNENTVPSSAVIGTTLFEAGKSAMAFQGTWNQFPLQVKFPVGSFLVPSLVGSNPHATKLNTSGNIGGPSGAFEFQIATPRADHTMTPAKFQAALAWLQFIGTPQHDQEIVNEGQMAVPILKGTHPSKSMTTMAYHPVTGAPWDIATSQASSAIWQDFVNYLDGQMTFKQVKASFETAEAQTYAAWMKEYHWKF